MAVKIVGTLSVLNIVDIVTESDIMVENTPNYAILPLGLDEMTCSSFEGCSVPLYECLFTRLRIRLPFFKFEVVVIDHFNTSPSQLHYEAWDFMKVF